MKILLIFSAFVVSLVALSFLITRPPKNPGRLDSFAKCLAQKRVTMYGAVWCPHCQAQKQLFGNSFQLVPYVECPNNPRLCVDKGVTGYPTWIIGNTKLEGEQSLDKLSEVSSCQLF